MSDIQDEVDDTSAVPDSGATGRESVPAEGALQHQAEGTSQEQVESSAQDDEQPKAVKPHTLGQQGEMPFAVVDGTPVTQLPMDLYIPPDALEVILEAFEGPLDLLLYLIKRQNLDILSIKVAEITKQYMDYIEFMTDIQWILMI